MDNQTAEIITATRRRRGQTLEAFAEELFTHAGNVMRWEKGQRDISTETLEAWWADERGWVQSLAAAILAVRYPGLVRYTGYADNGKTAGEATPE